MASLTKKLQRQIPHSVRDDNKINTEILRYAQDDRNAALLRMTGKGRSLPYGMLRSFGTKNKGNTEVLPLRTTNRNRVLSIKDNLSVRQGMENSH